MERYKCEICGKKHRVFRGLESPAPAMLRAMSDEERRERVLEHDGIFVVDKKHMLIKGWLQIFHQQDSTNSFFNWQVWISVDAGEFVAKNELFQANQEVRMEGKLESEIIMYDRVIGLKAEVLFSPQIPYPTVRVLEQSKIKLDQTKPISSKRVAEIMNRIHHRELFAPPVYYDTPFIVRLREELSTCQTKYSPDGFMVNVSSPTEVLFQIIPRKHLEGINSTRPGYGLHLAFDFQDESSKEHFQKMQELKENQNWQYHELDGVPIYQLDVQNDEQKLREISVVLIQEVFSAAIGQVAVDSFEI